MQPENRKTTGRRHTPQCVPKPTADFGSLCMALQTIYIHAYIHWMLHKRETSFHFSHHFSPRILIVWKHGILYAPRERKGCVTRHACVSAVRACGCRWINIACGTEYIYAYILYKHINGYAAHYCSVVQGNIIIIHWQAIQRHPQCRQHERQRMESLSLTIYNNDTVRCLVCNIVHVKISAVDRGEIPACSAPRRSEGSLAIPI